MKKTIVALAGITLFFIFTMNVLAQEITSAFSSVEYLSANAAATKASEMMQVSHTSALELIKAATAKIPAKATRLLPTLVTPAYIYSHVDIGNQTYMEFGAVILISKNSEISQISEIISSYCRPVNNAFKWTPSNKLTVTVENKTQLRFSVAGEAFVKSLSVSEGYKKDVIKNFTDFGFTETLDGAGLIKPLSITTSFDLSKASSLTEKDIAEAYITMLTHFQNRARVSFKDRSKVAIELRTPVGMTEQGQKVFLSHVSKLSGGEQPLETNADTFNASWNSQKQAYTLADCLLKIESVSIVGDKISFKISGVMGLGEYHVLSSNEIKRNSNGIWDVVNPNQVDLKIS